ncbi:MAG: ABC transporter ATP-binding protein [Spirochaetes bacterium]|nr:ABC transporter ATP-binding protein [Spirochaetota bacterium]
MQISIKNLYKNYQLNGLEVPAIRGIDLTIKKGEFSAIAGPSGSGKTTLLNIIGGLDRPTAGEIRVGNDDLNKLNQKELSDLRLHRIGFIFQAYNLIPVLTALENVEYVLLLQGVLKEERTTRSTRILEEVGLGEYINRFPKELSGGQQQRVAVARAIVSEPEIILADEPTANLDQKTGALLLDLMHDLNHKKNITFLFSTHDQMVMEKARRLVYLTDGTSNSDTFRGHGHFKDNKIKKKSKKKSN